jgi:hypothetical protein
MPESVVGINSCGGRQGLAQRGIERCTGPRLRCAQARLDLRPARLDRRQIRRVGGPIQEAGHGGPTRPEAPPIPKRLTPLCQRGIGLLMEYLAHHRQRRLIAAGRAASRMRPRRNPARAPAARASRHTRG